MGTIYVKYAALEPLSRVGGVIFDCDGVLIDEKTSYDKVIQEVTVYLTHMLTGYTVDASAIKQETIYDIRAIGSFNNDSNTIQLLVEWLVDRISAELDNKVTERMTELRSKNFTEMQGVLQSRGKVSSSMVENWLRDLSGKVAPFSGSAAALTALEEEIGIDMQLTKMVKDVLKPGGRYGESLLTTVFDEAYYGSENVQKVRNAGPFFSFTGKLDEEKLIVSRETLEKLSQYGIRMGICTGRGSWETWRTLGEFSRYFVKEACMFISDYITIDPVKYSYLEKPSPIPLLEALKGLGGDEPKLYVGNSAEDHIMFQRALSSRENLLFAGVTDNDYRRLDYMFENEADLILSSVNQLAKVFQLLREE
uniref:Hydrolase n=1 Tax=Caldiarchaeum subterraneum TaxID=311458 RepID=E6N2Y5_CALS0|nr:hydrolase [Candidatus Caldarchaeum subterraneum]